MATTIYLIRPETYPVTSYLLDDYTAAAAYSLRQLKTGVTSVVRVRRSSDNAESDFSASEITDGTLTTWTGANDGFCTVLYNQVTNGVSGNAFNLTSTSQPKLVSSGTVLTKGGLPCLDFDGSNDLLATSVSINTTDVSYFSVVSAESTGVVGCLFTQDNSTNATIRLFIDSRSTGGIYRNMLVSNGVTNYAADLSTSYGNTDQRLLSSFIDSSKNISSFDNGNTGGTDTYTGTTSSGTKWIGNQSGGLYMSARLQELIIFNTDESANRTAIESDINTYYSIY